MNKLLLLSIFLPTLNANDYLLENSEFSLYRVLDFIETKFTQIHFDGLLGVTFAHAFLKNSLAFPMLKSNTETIVDLIKTCQRIHNKIYPLLPNDPKYMITFRHKLLDPGVWSKSIPNKFTLGEIEYLGYYKNWTSDTIKTNKKASYKGLKSDVCLREILEFSQPNTDCFISKVCWEMMLHPNRVDYGYLLTHRLLYLQVVRLQGCTLPNNLFSAAEYTKTFCSYIYKEIITSEILGYPYQDIFLEQVVLCGMEGYMEFLNKKWLGEIFHWQTPHGCYQSIRKNITKRTSFDIDYGCSDHSTGLGAAALALYLRFLSLTNDVLE